MASSFCLEAIDMENPRTTMIARVLQVKCASLLVCDCFTEQEVVVQHGPGPLLLLWRLRMHSL